MGDCWCCSVVYAIGGLISILGAIGFAGAAWYGLTVEMIEKGDWGWRNWQALILTSSVSVASLFHAVAVGWGMIVWR